LNSLCAFFRFFKRPAGGGGGGGGGGGSGVGCFIIKIKLLFTNLG
jgi:hypothetical protein